MNITQIFSDNIKMGAFVVIAEADAAGNAVASKGPFTFNVDDPQSVATVAAGAADNSTPTRITANGSGKVGSVTVTVTDSSNQAVGKATLAIVAPVVPPPPPPVVPTLTVSFVAGT